MLRHMGDHSKTISHLVDRMEICKCDHCGIQIDVSDLTLFDTMICPNCSAAGTVPCQLGPYRVEGRIGAGAMGTVYKATDSSLHREVAIKVLKKQLGENKKAVDGFKHEAVAIAQLSHPNIAQIYAFGEEKGQPYIVMEYLPHDSLGDLMEKYDKLDPLFVMQVGMDIARALEAASEVGIVHGDVKPENIALNNKFQAKLVDFGLATFEHELDVAIMGTPYYISPERLKGMKVDTRADMYSLGATLYHALAGRPPFTGDTPAECAKARLTKPPPPLPSGTGIGAGVKGLIMRMMARDVGKRHPTYTSLVGDFRRVIMAMGPGKTRSPSMSIKRHMRTARSASSITSGAGAYSKRTTQAAASQSKSNPVPAIIAGVIILGGVLIGLSANNCSRRTPPRSYSKSFSKTPAPVAVPVTASHSPSGSDSKTDPPTVSKPAQAVQVEQPQAAPVVATIGDGDRVFLLADSNRGILKIDKDGRIVGRYGTGDMEGLNDVWQLSNENMLYSTDRNVREIRPQDGTVVWEYVPAAKEPRISSCQPLQNGKVLIAESGQKRLIEVDRKGDIVKEVDVGAGTKMARFTKNGTYIVACRDDQLREFDRKGKLLTSQKVKGAEKLYGCVRLNNGNTLVSTGPGGEVLQLDGKGRPVWKIERKDLAKQLPTKKNVAMAAAGIQRLSNGNTIISCPGSDPQLVEVRPDKTIVWYYSNPDLQKTVTQFRLGEDGDPAKMKILR